MKTSYAHRWKLKQNEKWNITARRPEQNVYSEYAVKKQ